VCAAIRKKDVLMPDSTSRAEKRYVWVPAALFQDPPHIASRATFAPAFDVVEHEDRFVVRADMPGVRAEDIDVKVAEDRLVVTGKRRSAAVEDRTRVIASERGHGAFSRTLPLPAPADIQGVRAELKDGVLMVVIPRKAPVDAGPGRRRR
jgi:HSP20 family molecular chaperone IbpA